MQPAVFSQSQPFRLPTLADCVTLICFVPSQPAVLSQSQPFRLPPLADCVTLICFVPSEWTVVNPSLNPTQAFPPLSIHAQPLCSDREPDGLTSLSVPLTEGNFDKELPSVRVTPYGT